MNLTANAKYDHKTKTWTYPFTDKASYLSWRNLWRLQYKALTADIREAKAKRRQPGDEQASWQSKCATLRVDAYCMMHLLDQAKAQSRAMKASTAQVTA